MTEKLRRILDNMHQYNVSNLAAINFGMDDSTVYDALVVAPSYTPYKLLRDGSFRITETGGDRTIVRAFSWRRTT